MSAPPSPCEINIAHEPSIKIKTMVSKKDASYFMKGNKQVIIVFVMRRLLTVNENAYFFLTND